MPKHATGPTVAKSHGNLQKQIGEYVGRGSTGDHSVSVANVHSPTRWREPGQRPLFREITRVLAAVKHAVAGRRAIHRDRPAGIQPRQGQQGRERLSGPRAVNTGGE